MEKSDDDIGALIKAQARYHKAPDTLRARIAAQLTDDPIAESQKQSSAPKSKPAGWKWPRPAFAARGAQWWGLGGAFSAGAILATVGTLLLSPIGQPSRLADQAVDSHIRSLMVSHLSDVISSDQHTVKPWFDGKLTYSPPVRDFATQGYPLVGGRLDYLDGRPVAALIYRHRLHAINVFVWPSESKDGFVPTSTIKQGFNVESWRADGMEFWAVSDVQAADLHAFAQLLQSKEAAHGIMSGDAS